VSVHQKSQMYSQVCTMTSSVLLQFKPVLSYFLLTVHPVSLVTVNSVLRLVGSMRTKSVYSVTGPAKAQLSPDQSGVMRLERLVELLLNYFFL